MGLYNIRGKIRYNISNEALASTDKDRLELVTVREALQGIGAVYGHDFSYYDDKSLMGVYEGLSQLFKARENNIDARLQDIEGLEKEVYQKENVTEDIFAKMTNNSTDLASGKNFMDYIRDYLTNVVDDEKESLSKENLNSEISTENGTIRFEMPNGEVGTKDVEIPMKDGANVTMSALKTNIMAGKMQAKNLIYEDGGLLSKMQKLNDSKFFGNSSSFKKVLEAAKAYDDLMKKEGKKAELSVQQKEALGRVMLACDDYLDAKDKQHEFNATFESIENGDMPKFKTESGKQRYQEVSELSNLIKGQLNKVPESDRDRRLATEKKEREIAKTKVQTKDKDKEQKLEMGVLQ